MVTPVVYDWVGSVDLQHIRLAAYDKQTSIKLESFDVSQMG